jgi:hypothetical protein
MASILWFINTLITLVNKLIALSIEYPVPLAIIFAIFVAVIYRKKYREAEDFLNSVFGYILIDGKFSK